MNPDRLVLLVASAVFAGFGVAFVVAPAPLAALVDIHLATPRALVEFSTVYGGLELGVAAALYACSRRDAFVKPGLLLSFLALTGVVVVRAVGMLMHGVDTTLLALAVPEAIGAAASFWGLRWRPRERSVRHRENGV